MLRGAGSSPAVLLQLYIVSCGMIEPRCAERWQVRPDEQFDLVVISQLFYIVPNNSYLCIGVGTSGMRAIPRRWASCMYRCSHSLANPHAPDTSSHPSGWLFLFCDKMNKNPHFQACYTPSRPLQGGSGIKKVAK